MLTNRPIKLEQCQHPIRLMNQQKGLALVECFCVIACTMIILSQALPMGTYLICAYDSISAMNMLSSALARARLTAITHHESVSLCPSNDGVSCRPNFNWSQGWIVFHGSSFPSKAPIGQAIMQYEPLRTQLTIISTPGRTVIRFLPDGRSAGSNVRLHFCSNKTLLGAMVVNNLGRIRSIPVRPNALCEDELRLD